MRSSISSLWVAGLSRILHDTGQVGLSCTAASPGLTDALVLLLRCLQGMDRAYAPVAGKPPRSTRVNTEARNSKNKLQIQGQDRIVYSKSHH